MPSGPRQADAGRHRGPLGRALGGRRRLPLRRDRPTARGVLDRHATADGVRVDPHGHDLRLHPDRRPRPVPADARARRCYYPIGWDDNGLATERRVQNYFGVRCDPSQPYQPGFAPPYRGDSPADHQAVPISRPNFVELCHELTAIDEAVFEDALPAPRAVVSTGRCSTRRSTTSAGARARSPSCATWPGRGLQRRRADACGTSTTARRSPRPRSRTASARAPTTCSRSTAPDGDVLDRHHPARAASSAASPSSPTPTTSATGRCSAPRCARRCSASRCPSSAIRWPSRTRARHRDGLHVRRHHRRHLVARARPADAQRHRPRRPLRRRPRPTWLATDDARAAYEPLAGRTVKQAQTAIVELLRRSGELHGDPRPITHPVKFYERGTPAARDRHQPPVVHPQRRPRPGPRARRSSRAARSWPGSPTTCATATSTGSRASTATG